LKVIRAAAQIIRPLLENGRNENTMPCKRAASRSWALEEHSHQ